MIEFRVETSPDVIMIISRSTAINKSSTYDCCSTKTTMYETQYPWFMNCRWFKFPFLFYSQLFLELWSSITMSCILHDLLILLVLIISLNSPQIDDHVVEYKQTKQGSVHNIHPTLSTGINHGKYLLQCPHWNQNDGTWEIPLSWNLYFRPKDNLLRVNWVSTVTPEQHANQRWWYKHKE